jgi:hypothetical protein
MQLYCKNSLRQLYFAIAILAILLTGCGSLSNITTPAVGDIDIIIEPCLKVDQISNEEQPAPLISFEELSLETGTIDRDYMNPWAGKFQEGDSCLLITGTIRNGYGEGRWVAYQGTGYDDSGNIVSQTLDSGPVVGIAQIYIEGNSAEEFNLHLSWSYDVILLKISSQVSEIMFP